MLHESGSDVEAAVGPPRWDEEQAPGLRRSAGAFLRQLGWREFGHHLLAAFPHTVAAPLHERFAAFPWRDDPAALEAWRRGRTGYPIVDAALRQLWTTGWMHNRTRMLAGSFLVKDLLLPWQDGAAWFWDTLVDADLANNTLGWQWVGGCGADAAPYFRVFNPVTQGLRFDPDAAYVRRWVPELAGLSAEQAQAPWKSTPEAQAAAGVTLGETYPAPIVDHGEARRAGARRLRGRAQALTAVAPERRADRSRGRGRCAQRAGRSSGTISGTGRPSGPTVTSASVRGRPNRALPAAPGLRNSVCSRHSTAALWLWPLTTRS